MKESLDSNYMIKCFAAPDDFVEIRRELIEDIMCVVINQHVTIAFIPAFTPRSAGDIADPQLSTRQQAQARVAEASNIVVTDTHAPDSAEYMVHEVDSKLLSFVADETRTIAKHTQGTHDSVRRSDVVSTRLVQMVDELINKLEPTLRDLVFPAL